MVETDLALAPVYLPLVGAALAFVAKAFPRKGSAAAKALEYSGAFVGLALPWLALAYLAPLAASGGAVEGVIGGWAPQLAISYRFDGLAWMVDLLGFSVAGAAWLYALGAGPKGPAFTSIFLIQASALAATAATTDLFNLFVCLEVLGMASYVLVTSSEKPGAFLASFSYLMVSAAAMVFFLLGVYGLYRLTGALEYGALSRGLSALPKAGGAVAAASVASVAAAVALRTAVMPLYGWLPDAHALAPHAVSAVLSGVLIKTPLFALSRVLIALPGGDEVGMLLGYAGGFTALAAVLIALSQKDVKRLLAYHSISQIGYVVAAWGAGTALLARGEPAGTAFLAAAFMHAFFHALFKGLLFLTVGTISDAAGERDVYLLRGAGKALKAAGERLPITGLAFAVGALSISAIPPFNGYASKAMLSYVLKGRWEYLFLFAAGIGTLASFIKLSTIFWPAAGTAAAGAKALGREPSPCPVPDPSLAVPDPSLAAPEGAKAAPYRMSASVGLAQALLALACVGTGLAAPAFYAAAVRYIGPPGAYASVPALYGPAELGKTLIVIVGGGLLYLATRTKSGKAVAKAIRERPRGFHGLFAAFCLGLAGLYFWMTYIA